MSDPSNRVHDEFRPRSIGGRTAPFNSKPATDNFHIDRSRLGVHEEYDPEVPNDWGSKGKYVTKPNSIMDNVRGAMGGIGARSSYKSVHEPAAPTNVEIGCCPSPFSTCGINPLTKRKGD